MEIFFAFKLSRVLNCGLAISQYEILSDENQIARVAKPVIVALTEAGPTPA